MNGKRTAGVALPFSFFLAASACDLLCLSRCVAPRPVGKTWLRGPNPSCDTFHFLNQKRPKAPSWMAHAQPATPQGRRNGGGTNLSRPKSQHTGCELEAPGALSSAVRPVAENERALRSVRASERGGPRTFSVHARGKGTKPTREGPPKMVGATERTA